MNIERITQLSETNDIEMINCHNAMPITSSNKFGNVTRAGETYPDVIELLVKEQTLSNQWNRGSDQNMGELYFPAVNDMYFYTTQNVHARSTLGRGWTYVEATYGLYYRRTTSTITESDDYIYVSNTYDLYYSTHAAQRGALTGPQVNNCRLVSGSPETSDADRRGLRVCRTTVSNLPTDQRRYGWDRDGRYLLSHEGEVRAHLRRRIYPRMQSHLTGENVGVVTNAMTTVSAFRKDFPISPIDPDSTVLKDYSWTLESELQSEYKRYLYGNRNSDTINSLNRATEVVVNSNNDKKHESMLVKINARLSPERVGDERTTITVAARLISTSETPGDLENQIRDILETPSDSILEGISPTVLLTDKVGIDYYDGEEYPIRYDLELLTGEASKITLVRTSEEAGKSPMGNALSEMCQFNDGVYQIPLDRPIELHLDERKLSLEKGTYVVCVDDVSTTDFLWYLAVINTELSDVTLKEITSRLTMSLEDMSSLESIGYAGRNISVSNDQGTDQVRFSPRLARGNVYFDETDD